MEVLEAGDSALVIMESTLDYLDADGAQVHANRRATYVFRRGADGRWLCAIDNSYGTALLDA
jgi:ketosteroid isomerase-like protein